MKPPDENLLLDVPEGDQWTGTPGQAHTAMRFKERDPEKYAAVTDALRTSGNITQTAKAFHVSVHTCYAIIEAELGGIEKFRLHLQKKAFLGAHVCFERATELAGEMKNGFQVAMMGAVMVDKGQMLAGLPTQVVRHEHFVSEEAAAKLAEGLEALRAKVRAEREAQGRVVEEEQISGTAGGCGGPVSTLVDAACAPPEFPPVPDNLTLNPAPLASPAA